MGSAQEKSWTAAYVRSLAIIKRKKRVVWWYRF